MGEEVTSLVIKRIKPHKEAHLFVINEVSEELLLESQRRQYTLRLGKSAGNSAKG